MEMTRQELLIHRQAFQPIVSTLFLVGAGVLLIGLQEKPLGWGLFGLGFVSLLGLERKHAKELLLPYLLLAILGITPIGTELSSVHMATMGATLIAAIALPAVVDRMWLGSVSLVRFPWRMGRAWNARERGYIALTIVLAYFVLPFYLRETGAYLN